METKNASRWEWSPEEIRSVGYRVADIIADYLTALPNGPVFQPFPSNLADQFMCTPVPDKGEDANAILDQFIEQLQPFPFGNGHPRFFGWVNSPPVVIGVMAEALAAAMNPSCAGGNHAAIHVERQVLNWFRDLLGFPDGSMGLLVSGGSMANLTALAVARNAKAGSDLRSEGLQRIESPLILYMGDEGHSCIRKAAELMGIGSHFIRTIPSDEHYRMQVPTLEAAIQRDLELGYKPFAVAATAGTVNTGAIDPLPEIAELCRHFDLWFHVDGAYGAPALLSGTYELELDALALADSIALDPHKWLYIPLEAGLVMVRDGSAMRDTFSLVPPYLRTDGNLEGVGGPPWFSEYGFQQSRGFRALKVWMALKYHGVEGYKEAIEHDIALAQHLAELVQAAPDLELLASQSLSIVCFRYNPPDMQGADPQLNKLNQALLQDIQLGGQAFLSGTVLRNRFALRACIVNHRTSLQDIDFLVDHVRARGALLYAHGK